jgi:cytochrome c oxidase assembly protein subunit 11
MSSQENLLATKHRKVLRSAVLVVLGMFGFGFALVPLYDVFCEVTGLNGKTQGRVEEATVARQASDAASSERIVRVQFVTTTNANMPWEFRPSVREVRVKPGEETDVTFYAANLTDEDMVGQAVPSVAPSAGARFFLKTECFCFEQQPLHAGQNILMNVRFLVDADLPEDIHTLTLSYTLFDITEHEPKTKS